MSRRFEDLMDVRGRIRLRIQTFPVNSFLACHGCICRGFMLANGTGAERDLERGGWLMTLQFERRDDVDERGRIHILRNFIGNPDKNDVLTVQKHREADFDAMLAALEPYELVTDAADEPLTVEAR